MADTILRIAQTMANIYEWNDLYVRLLGKFGPDVLWRDERLPGEINAGRWTIRCPWCSNTMLGDPTWQEIGCVDCGRIYNTDYPDQATVAQIEAALLVRPQANRHWAPPETVQDLLDENVEHGVGG